MLKAGVLTLLTHFPDGATEAKRASKTQQEAPTSLDQKLALLPARLALLTTPWLFFSLCRAPHAPEVTHAIAFHKPEVICSECSGHMSFCCRRGQRQCPSECPGSNQGSMLASWFLPGTRGTLKKAHPPWP